MKVRKQTLFRLAMIMTVPLLLFAAVAVAEVAFRAVGHKPFKPPAPYSVEGKPLFRPDPELGLIINPGAWVFPRLKEAGTIRVTHSRTGRVTVSRAAVDSSGSRGSIWIFGCSYTYGWGVSDEETYPWLVAEALPNWEVVNFAVPGFGTVHGLLQIKRLLRSGKKPTVIVIAYAYFHDQRNTYLRKRGKEIFLSCPLQVRHPYAVRGDDGSLVFKTAPITYREWPLMRRSALVHWLERQYLQWEASRTDSRAVTKALLKETVDLCDRHDIKLVVAGIDENRRGDTEEILDYCRRLGVPTVDIAVDLRNTRYSFRPLDAHPNSCAHELYARRLTAFLKAHVLPSLTEGSAKGSSNRSSVEQ